jgi:hypothetical protein
MLGQHATVGFTAARIREDGGTAVLPQCLEDLPEQGAHRFL